ncbi:MAG TPA: addiction module antidote protein [Chthonomonadaceae bacterium]|nr:addiction module antidote protein [Chthonomonadaceae bacterium]
MPLKDFNNILDRELEDTEFVQAYLNASLEEGLEAFLVALRDVIRVNGGVRQVAETSKLGRESLYKTLSQAGNPHFRTVQTLLDALGLRLNVTRKQGSESEEALHT